MERKITRKGNRKFKRKIWDLSLNSTLCSNFLGPPGILQALEHRAKGLFWWLSLTYANRLKAFPRLPNVLTKLTYEQQFIFINIWSLIVRVMLMMTAYCWAKLYTRLGCELGKERHPENALREDDSGCGRVRPLSVLLSSSSGKLVSISLSQGPATALLPVPKISAFSSSSSTSRKWPVGNRTYQWPKAEASTFWKEDFRSPLQGPCTNPQILQCIPCTHSWPGHHQRFDLYYLCGYEGHWPSQKFTSKMYTSTRKILSAHFFFFRVQVLGQKNTGHSFFLSPGPRGSYFCMKIRTK